MREWSPGVAAVLSFVIPGLGQIYKGQVLNGLVWLVFVVVGYAAFILPGLFLHLCCIIGAASGDPYAGSRRVAVANTATPAPATPTKWRMPLGTAVGCPACGRTVKVGQPSCGYCHAPLSSA
jgi:hypothetical protein